MRFGSRKRNRWRRELGSAWIILTLVSPLRLSELSRNNLDNMAEIFCTWLSANISAVGGRPPVLRQGRFFSVCPEAAIGRVERKRAPSHRLLLDLSPATALRKKNYCSLDAISTCISGIGEIESSPIKGRS